MLAGVAETHQLWRNPPTWQGSVSLRTCVAVRLSVKRGMCAGKAGYSAICRKRIGSTFHLAGDSWLTMRSAPPLPNGRDRSIAVGVM